MPQPAYQKDKQLVQISAQRALAVAAQRDIEIIAEPACEADVPAPPQGRKRGGAQRLTEVFGECKAKHRAGADGHIAPGRKIAVELISIQKAGQKQHGPGIAAILQVAVHGVHHAAEGIGEYELFEKAPQNAKQPSRHAVIFKGRRRF